MTWHHTGVGLSFWPLTFCVLSYKGGSSQSDMYGLGSEQLQVRRVHRGPGGAAVWRAGREERQVLHQTPGPKGQSRVLEDHIWTKLRKCGVMKMWFYFFTVWETKLHCQRHGVFTRLHQNSHRTVWQHHLCLQNRRGVVSSRPAMFSGCFCCEHRSLKWHISIFPSDQGRQESHLQQVCSDGEWKCENSHHRLKQEKSPVLLKMFVLCVTECSDSSALARRTRRSLWTSGRKGEWLTSLHQQNTAKKKFF